MALEKQSKFIPPIEEIERIKSKHIKNPTVCKDQRRKYNHCGICGYSDTAFQGVEYCTECGNEQEILYLESDRTDYLNRWKNELKCCVKKYKFTLRGREKIREVSAVKRYGISVCLACGAIEGPACPNCKHLIWHKGSKKYCKSCGFTIN